MTDIILDASSLYARSYFAADKASGRPDPVKAIQFFLNTLLNLLNPDVNLLGQKFDRSLFAWDSVRNKAKNRAEKPAEYHPTKELLLDILSQMLGARHYWHDAYEADDVVATAVYKSDPLDTVYVCSGDKDLMQLQGGNCEYYCFNTKAVLSRGFIQNKFNVKKPNQVAIALAILGDKVDNIPGIKGWGPKKVMNLFHLVTPKMDFDQALQTIEAQIPAEHQQVFYESLERVLLKTDVPNVPVPEPLLFAEPETIELLGIPDLRFRYEQVYELYGS